MIYFRKRKFSKKLLCAYTGKGTGTNPIPVILIAYITEWKTGVQICGLPEPWPR